MQLNQIIQGDCLQTLKENSDKIYDLIILDPPYNIGIAEWDKIDNYIKWMGQVLTECQRVLKDNGSMYLFHNDMMQIIDLMTWIRDNTDFVFKQFIVWDKWHNEFKAGNDLQGAFYKIVNNPSLRNYPKMAEYILFYTFQDKTIIGKRDAFKQMRKYSQIIREHCNYTRQIMSDKLGNESAQHFLEPYGPQWQLCTPETYQKLIVLFGIDTMNGFKTYHNLKKEYDDAVYVFNQYNNQTSVWCYPIPNTKERKNHPTQKPLELIKNIILHSTKENDLVLDPFLGSGTTCIAAKQLKRNYIGIELDENYYRIAKKRLSTFQTPLSDFKTSIKGE